MKTEKELFASVMILGSALIAVMVALYFNPLCFHRFDNSPLCLVAPNQADLSGNGIVSLPVKVCRKCGLVQVPKELLEFSGFKVETPINVTGSPIPEEPKTPGKKIEEKKIDTKSKKSK